MIYSVPMNGGGYGYFAGPEQAPQRRTFPGERIAAELAAPLLPITAIPQGSGMIARGRIAYPQNRQQVDLLSSLPEPRPTAAEEAEDWSLGAALVRGALTSAILGIF